MPTILPTVVKNVNATFKINNLHFAVKHKKQQKNEQANSLVQTAGKGRTRQQVALKIIFENVLTRPITVANIQGRNSANSRLYQISWVLLYS